MRYVIVGAGAIGNTVGYYLTKAGRSVVLIGNRRHVKKIAGGGLDFLSHHTETKLTMPALGCLADLQPQTDDVIMLCVKTFDTEAACGVLREKYGEAPPVICLQNTMENEPIAQKHFRRVYGGGVYINSKYLEYGETVHAIGDRILVGAYPKGSVDDTLRALAEASVEGEMLWVPVDNIIDFKWAKWLFNLNNATLGIIGYSVPQGYADRAALDLMADVLEEAYEIMRAAGITLGAAEGVYPFPDFIHEMRKPGFMRLEPPADKRLHSHASMVQDLMWRRGKTEVEHLNGRVVRLGREHGMPAPYNEVLTEILSNMATRRLPPGLLSVAELRALCEDRKAEAS